MAGVKPLWGEVFAMPPGTTGEDVAHLPDDGYRYELYEGELVREMTFAGHARLCQRLGYHLETYANATGEPVVVLQNALFDLTPHGASRRTVLALDVAILRATTALPWNAMTSDLPLLAIEVVSDSQTLAELTLKAQVYRQAGVEEVWVIDHKTRVVEVWNAQGQATLDDTQTLTSALLPDFSLAVRALLDG